MNIGSPAADPIEVPTPVHPRSKEARAKRKLKQGDIFIVVTNDQKQGTMYPEIIGPFDDWDLAEKFGMKYIQCQIDSHLGSEGGYADWHIVGRMSAQSPADYIKQWNESWGSQ